MTMKLYDLAAAEDDRRFSPYCWRAKMALKHKGLEFETIPWRFVEQDAIAFSGQGLVPVLVRLRLLLVQSDYIAGKGPGFADYVLFGAFQWARCVSPIRLLEPDDPVYSWRERLLDLWEGYGREAKGFPVWA